MKAITTYITVQQLATRLGISVRAVQKKLQTGKPIPHVKRYSKLREAQTSAYLIEPAADFFPSPTPRPEDL